MTFYWKKHSLEKALKEIFEKNQVFFPLILFVLLDTDDKENKAK